MLPYLAIWGAAVATMSLVMAFARTGPDEARSKLAEWAELLKTRRRLERAHRRRLEPLRPSIFLISGIKETCRKSMGIHMVLVHTYAQLCVGTLGCNLEWYQ